MTQHCIDVYVYDKHIGAGATFAAHGGDFVGAGHCGPSEALGAGGREGAPETAAGGQGVLGGFGHRGMALKSLRIVRFKGFFGVLM